MLPGTPTPTLFLSFRPGDLVIPEPGCRQAGGNPGSFHSAPRKKMTHQRKGMPWSEKGSVPDASDRGAAILGAVVVAANCSIVCQTAEPCIVVIV